MDKIGFIEIRITGSNGNLDLSPDNYDIRDVISMLGFVDSLDAVGKNLDQANGRFDDAVKQLHTGGDNFFGQSAKMKGLLNYQEPKDFSPERLDFGRHNDTSENSRQFMMYSGRGTMN